MSLFEQLVTEALKNNPQFAPLKMVVEKELLHHDILRIMRDNNLLKNLTFIGGTCLRACYGGIRLSEDLDFTGGIDFAKEQLSELGDIMCKNLQAKYGLVIKVTEPIKDNGNVQTWKIIIETRPNSKYASASRINLDICTLPSYEKRPVMLRNIYGVDMGTFGLVLQAQSLEEIYADKLMALALRPNRLKYRDLWDILWLHSHNIKPSLTLIPLKLRDREIEYDEYKKLYHYRLNNLQNNHQELIGFNQEMRRFLPENHLLGDDAWNFLISLLNDLGRLN
jgi:predicted nucleotidyltransferase component of viral defense system